ncbi:MAG: hypothetical protein H5U29_07510 [Pusillimonas sp.]|nr:hypothetical protein [Pusillimonas sp.]
MNNSYTGKSQGAQASENVGSTGTSGQRISSNWPFTPAASFPRSQSSQSGQSSSTGDCSGYRNRGFKGNGRLTRAAMVGDVCLVVVWGATIPGLMWLGTLGGF